MSRTSLGDIGLDPKALGYSSLALRAPIQQTPMQVDKLGQTG